MTVADTTPDRHALIAAYHAVRELTEQLAGPLSPEDQILQSMPDASPTKWHRGHTTWFFETFVLAPLGVPAYDPRFAKILNSYYVALGPRHPRPARGMLSRPSCDEIAEYRRTVDGRVVESLLEADDSRLAELAPLIELGLAHEQQHQELLLTDIWHALSQNPLAPTYRPASMREGALSAAAGSSGAAAGPMTFTSFDGGLVEIGATPKDGFHYDNEGPAHRVWLEPFELADRLVTVGEWKAFADAGGYDTASLWLSAGFDWVRSNGVDAPLYTRREGSALVEFGLDGERELSDAEPVTHVTYYEADAIAAFLGARLPTEAEWETAARRVPADGNFLVTGPGDSALRARPAPGRSGPRQIFGDAWEWTRSAYEPYPGFRIPEGAIGEYNGKFMIGQQVLRGGSCLTPRGHVRATYRNFWPAATRFQFTGVRLARSIGDERP
ncbi:MAG: ergothioneine biosynthesis protein EgtB [Candidatus Eisenbacteria bacterium]